jgi:hypothetical protein
LLESTSDPSTDLLSLAAAASTVLLAETDYSSAIPVSEVELLETNDFSGYPVAVRTPLVPDLDKLPFPEALELPTDEEELPLLPGFPPLLLPLPALLLPMPEPPRLPLLPPEREEELPPPEPPVVVLTPGLSLQRLLSFPTAEFAFLIFFRLESPALGDSEV